MKLTLEGYRDRDDVTSGDVVRAVGRIADPSGPTFVILEDSAGNYVQAAGTDGRYIVESRTVYGEGFQHYRMYRQIAGPDAADVVYHRKKCDRHPPRRCPLRVRKSEICDLGTVEIALCAFLQTGERAPSLLWRDVTDEEMAAATRRRPEDEIRTIRPGPG